MYKFSIIIPIYNMGDSINKTISSLLSQDYNNYEIILVDDGSTDDSGLICDELANSNNKIRVVHTENHGSGPARNIGIYHACGDYVFFPDADDYISEKALSRFNAVLEKNEVDLIVFGYKNVSSKGHLLSVKEYESRLFSGLDIRKDYSEFFSMDAKYGIQGAPWNKLFSLKLIKDNNIEFPNLRRHQDDAFIGIYMSFVKTVEFICDVLYSYVNNDLSKEWKKYPCNYLDCVMGLLECRKDSILLWNPEDVDTYNIVISSYITGVIKSLELSFSNKYNFRKRERKKYIYESIKKSNIEEYDIGVVSGLKYQKYVFNLIKKSRYSQLYLVLSLKVFVEHRLFFVLSILKKISK